MPKPPLPTGAVLTWLLLCKGDVKAGVGVGSTDWQAGPGNTDGWKAAAEMEARLKVPNQSAPLQDERDDTALYGPAVQKPRSALA